jgi:hypothetical protein
MLATCWLVNRGPDTKHHRVEPLTAQLLCPVVVTFTAAAVLASGGGARPPTLSQPRSVVGPLIALAGWRFAGRKDHG